VPHFSREISSGGTTKTVLVSAPYHPSELAPVTSRFSNLVGASHLSLSAGLCRNGLPPSQSSTAERDPEEEQATATGHSQVDNWQLMAQ